MRVREPAADLLGVFDRDRLGERAVVLDQLGERRPVDQFHDDEVRVVFAPDVVDADDVRIGQPRGGLRFVVETPNEFGVGRKLRAQHLDRDAAAQHRVGAGIDGGHSALADLPFEAIALPESPLGHEAT